MSDAMPEADWRVFRGLHPIWIERFCKRVIDELLRVLSDDSRDAHERYLAAYKLICIICIVGGFPSSESTSQQIENETGYAARSTQSCRLSISLHELALICL